MYISFFFLCILIFRGCSADTKTDNSECHESKKLDELCGTHTFQSVKPILDYVSQLQKEQLSYSEERKEINELREKVQQLQLKVAEGQSKDDLIVSLKTQIKDLQTTISDLMHNVNSELVELKTFIKENIDIKTKEAAPVPNSCTSFGESNDVHNIQLPNSETFPVLCNSEIAGPGWIVMQQRINGREDFYQDWHNYKNGFGDFTGDFFLGLEKIHRLTNNTPHELYIHMEAFRAGHYESLFFYARYDNFRIAGEDDKYRLLSLGTYSGNADMDRMRYHKDQQFSTYDSDNDADSGNCATHKHAGWWYKNCTDCNLNGKYYQHEIYKSDSNHWIMFYPLRTIKMLIRPRGK